MSEQWTPKVGDKVMVGEHGPYAVARVECYDGQQRCHVRDTSEIDYCVRTAWLSPAPDPEPDEPTAPGALVRDGAGNLLFRSTGDASRWYEVMTPGGGYWEWDEITRPITVVLADPAEVETLREKVAEGQRLVEEMTPALIERDALRAERDELQRRIDRALEYIGASVGALGTNIRRILRGES